MIRHIVLIKFRSDVSDGQIADLFAGLAALGARVPGMRGFDGGVSVSPEKLEQGFRHGFCIDFDDEGARDAYLEHPDHKVLGGQLVGMAEGGVSGLVVFDLEVRD